MSLYYVCFTLNGAFCNVQAKEDMMFAELTSKFITQSGIQLKEGDNPIYSFNSNQIKGDSCKTLKDLSIFSGAIIQVSGINSLNMANNAGNFGYGNPGFNQNQMGGMPFMGNMPYNQNYGMGNNGFNPWTGNMYGNYNMSPMANAQNNINIVNNNNVGNINNNPNVGNMGNAEDNKYLNIIFTLNGKPVNVQGEKDMKFSQVAQRLMTKAGITEEQLPIFISNSTRIEHNEPKTLSQLNIKDQAKIEVVLQKDVIGA